MTNTAPNPPNAPHDERNDPPIDQATTTGDHTSANPDRTDADRARDAAERRGRVEGSPGDPPATAEQNATAGPTEVEPTPGSTRGDGSS